MRWFLGAFGTFALLGCGSDGSTEKPAGDGGGGISGSPDASLGSGGAGSGGRAGAAGNPGGTGAVAASGGTTGSGGKGSGGNTSGGNASTGGQPDASAPDASPPKIGKPGCGFAAAAFCDTFDGAATVHGRAGELDPMYWGGARMQGQLSTTRAMGIGMAVIPACRPGISNHVWPDGDTLICNATPDVASSHLLAAAAAQNYGQNGYRIRQPFDFAKRTGKIVFDATVNELSPLHAWVSLSITEDPISLPGYAIRGNDEGSIIPKNAIEVHFANFGDQTRIFARNVHVFKDYVDTVYTPQIGTAPSFKAGKLNHYEFLISEQGIEVTVTPYSEDGKTFGAPEFDFKVNASVPFTRGYVHVSVHNHAIIKYTQPDSHPAIKDASVAQIDNVGFDGPVIEGWREYEVPDALVKFNEPLGDPYNTDNTGYDIGYFVDDESKGPKQVLHLKGVDTAGITSAKLAFSTWINFDGGGNVSHEGFAFRARLNGKSWRERALSAAELAFFDGGPTVVDPGGAPVGDPASQGRLAVLIDVPPGDLVPGDNTVEFVTVKIPTNYPPLVCNVDLVTATK